MSTQAHKLRPYQDQAVKEIRSHFAAGTRRVLLHLSTGGGKTTVFSHILKGVYSKDRHGMMAVRGRQLVDQGSKRLSRDGVDHGVLMANHWKKDARAKIQVCSIDTIMARNEFPPADLVVIDEAHMWTSPACVEMCNRYYEQGSYILSVTATPYTREPLTHLADVVVKPTSMRELIADGFLVPPRYFAPSAPDLTGVRTVSGEFVAEQVFGRMNVLSGDIVSSYRKLGQERPAVCFAVNIEHSQELVKQFRAAGIPAEHIEANHSFLEREAAIERLRLGKTKVLCNVGILCTGVDIPFLGCVIMARPTQSYNLYIQQAGRGTRLCPEIGKQDFILLDHAGNIIRHGFIADESPVDLSGRKKKGKVFTGTAPKLCKVCYLMYEDEHCPDCGPLEPDEDEGIFVAIDEQLVEITDNPEAFEVVQFVKRHEDQRKKYGYKKMWLFHKIRTRYGIELAGELMPPQLKQWEKYGNSTRQKQWWE